MLRRKFSYWTNTYEDHAFFVFGYNLHIGLLLSSYVWHQTNSAFFLVILDLWVFLLIKISIFSSTPFVSSVTFSSCFRIAERALGSQLFPKMKFQHFWMLSVMSLSQAYETHWRKFQLFGYYLKSSFIHFIN